ncbi:biopolymer transporter ExbD [Prevotella sp. A2931]|uniref:Biopolymer transporter ExbD n=1 Tax=Prevotella illustrans TaxID=2800387 RepID=A0ABS3M855_9BACT|nr:MULTISPECIES: biopolymer transporter ExbD [Prevotella]MBO1364373.1 biopolymer transporter ExbD [Prevotella illustrans]PTL26100.1 biopolymer transporter ExbD [Prevotella sp. oral taxon 820]
MSRFRRPRPEMLGLNTASLPDLIFSVLFFFMIVTHMRKVTLKVKYREPQGVELTRLTKKSAVTYIYIGKSLQGQGHSGKTVIQMNDRLVTPADIADYLSAERSKMAPEDRQLMTVSIKADRDTRMEVINEVKQALRQAKALRISYSATQKK